MSALDSANTETAGPSAGYERLVAAGEITPDPAQERAVARLQDLHQRLAGYEPDSFGRRLKIWLGRPTPPPRGLYLWGPVGRGKSMLMDLFFATAPLVPKRRVHFHEFMLETHAALHEWRRRLKRANEDADPIPPVAAAIAAEARLLCFDEFQVSDVADAMILGRLFTALFENGVVVVATSNRAPEELYAGGLNRQLFLPFIDLLKERLEVVELAGPTDYRLEAMTGHAVYHCPLGPAAEAEMDACWRRLTHGVAGAPATLRVQERRLTLPRASDGVARASFADLCEAPLGAADYLEIARRFHTLLLDRIPRLGPEQRNAAKRFVILIDALYEHRVKLVCSADAPPQALYPKGDGSFEFARTVSRLIEMQSADYLAAAHVA